MQINCNKNINPKDFPGDPLLKTLYLGGAHSIPVWGTKIPHAAQYGQKFK